MTEKNSSGNGRSAGISEKRLRSNLERWMKNPAWAEYYHGAPTERCRRFVALEFFYSWYGDDAAVREMGRIEAEMDITELDYLLRNCGNNPRRKVLHDRIIALGGS